MACFLQLNPYQLINYKIYKTNESPALDFSSKFLYLKQYLNLGNTKSGQNLYTCIKSQFEPENTCRIYWAKTQALQCKIFAAVSD